MRAVIFCHCLPAFVLRLTVHVSYAGLVYECPRCLESFHIVCLAPTLLGPAAAVRLIPVSGRCPQCKVHTSWVNVVAAVRKAERAAAQSARARQARRPRASSAGSDSDAARTSAAPGSTVDAGASVPAALQAIGSTTLVQPTPASILQRLRTVPEAVEVEDLDGSSTDSSVRTAAETVSRQPDRRVRRTRAASEAGRTRSGSTSDGHGARGASSGARCQKLFTLGRWGQRAAAGGGSS